MRLQDLETQKGIPIVWVDGMTVFARRDCSVTMIAFEAFDPIREARMEVARIVTPTEHVKSMVRGLCRHVDYYPEKQKDDKSTKDESDR